MASVFKKPTSQYWFAAFSDVNGRRLKRSTKTSDKRLAKEIADKFEDATRTQRTADQVRKVIVELHRRIGTEELVSTTLREYTANWIARKEPEVAASTLVFYRSATRAFVEFLGSKADRQISEISKDDVIGFRNSEAQRTAAKTANHKLKCVRMLFKDAKCDGYVENPPTEFVETVRQRKDTNKKVFTIDQIKAILAVADDEWRSMVMCGLYTGQRLSDIASLRWSNVDLVTGVIRLQTRKTGKEMTLPIAAPLREHLESMPSTDDPDAPLHPRASGILGSNTTAALLSNQFGDILAAAGLREKQPHHSTGKGRSGRRQRQDLSFHRLRATAATMMHEAGIPAAVCQALIGHDSADMHALYVSVGSDALTKAAASLPDVR